MAQSFNAASGKKAFYRADYPYLNPPTGELFSVKFCFSVKFARRASLTEKQLAPFAHKAAQLDAVFDKFSGEFAGNCILVDAIAGRALNYACLRL